jgi:hypothetical protein
VGPPPAAPNPWDWGLGEVVFLGDSASLELGKALAALGLGVFLVAEGFRVFARLGELLVPHGHRAARMLGVRPWQHSDSRASQSLGSHCGAMHNSQT